MKNLHGQKNFSFMSNRLTFMAADFGAEMQESGRKALADAQAQENPMEAVNRVDANAIVEGYAAQKMKALVDSMDKSSEDNEKLVATLNAAKEGAKNHILEAKEGALKAIYENEQRAAAKLAQEMLIESQQSKNVKPAEANSSQISASYPKPENAAGMVLESNILDGEGGKGSVVIGNQVGSEGWDGRGGHISGEANATFINTSNQPAENTSGAASPVESGANSTEISASYQPVENGAVASVANPVENSSEPLASYAKPENGAITSSVDAGPLSSEPLASYAKPENGAIASSVDAGPLSSEPLASYNFEPKTNEANYSAGVEDGALASGIETGPLATMMEVPYTPAGPNASVMEVAPKKVNVVRDVPKIVAAAPVSRDEKPTAPVLKGTVDDKVKSTVAPVVEAIAVPKEINGKTAEGVNLASIKDLLKDTPQAPEVVAAAPTITVKKPVQEAKAAAPAEAPAPAAVESADKSQIALKKIVADSTEFVNGAVTAKNSTPKLIAEHAANILNRNANKAADVKVDDKVKIGNETFVVKKVGTDFKFEKSNEQ